ncbi:hypothetical protein AUN14_19210 [Cronobacter muytjensii]|uniref:Uncharacterized protein n=1 Tax=Cronobacter muytjensii TaxID=413501 RepID=A0A2T7AKF5_9ENTR|nr:hypothetical protein AUN14_19210 [Cronobacter muytjensii]
MKIGLRGFLLFASGNRRFTALADGKKPQVPGMIPRPRFWLPESDPFQNLIRASFPHRMPGSACRAPQRCNAPFRGALFAHVFQRI